MELTVHFMSQGMTPCMMEGVPKEWGPGHRWSAAWEDVTCQECLRGREPIDTFTISPEGNSITCKRCNRTSYHPKDVENHYCGYCNVFHDDIWPPARQWWIDHPEPDMVAIHCACGWKVVMRNREVNEIAAGFWGKFSCRSCHTDLTDQILQFAEVKAEKS